MDACDLQQKNCNHKQSLKNRPTNHNQRQIACELTVTKNMLPCEGTLSSIRYEQHNDTVAHVSHSMIESYLQVLEGIVSCFVSAFLCPVVFAGMKEVIDQNDCIQDTRKHQNNEKPSNVVSIQVSAFSHEQARNVQPTFKPTNQNLKPVEPQV